MASSEPVWSHGRLHRQGVRGAIRRVLHRKVVGTVFGAFLGTSVRGFLEQFVGAFVGGFGGFIGGEYKHYTVDEQKSLAGRDARSPATRRRRFHPRRTPTLESGGVAAPFARFRRRKDGGGVDSSFVTVVHGAASGPAGSVTERSRRGSSRCAGSRAQEDQGGAGAWLVSDRSPATPVHIGGSPSITLDPNVIPYEYACVLFGGEAAAGANATVTLR